MKVKAIYQIAYKGRLYNGGDSFDIDAIDYPRYKNDVEVVESKVTKRRTKPIKKVQTK